MSKLLVHFHVYYQDQVPFFLEKLASIDGCQWDLYVTGSALSPQTETLIRDFKPDTRFVLVENVGYDVWPFIKVLRLVPIEEYDYVMKLHTKSAQNHMAFWYGGLDMHGFFWRDKLVNALLGSREQFAKVLSAFERYPSCGIQCSSIFVKALEYYMPEETDLLEAEMRRLHFQTSAKKYCAGTMFMARMAPYAMVRDWDVDACHFDKQSSSHQSGSRAHVYERLLSMVVLAAGFKMRPIYTKPYSMALNKEFRTYIAPIIKGLFSIERNRRTGKKYLSLFWIRFPLEK